MPRYKASVSYDGTDFCGWQAQKQDLPTVQGTIEQALFTWLREEITISGCGRTDSGVHARGYCFHFDTEATVDNAVYKLNALLPTSIAIEQVVPTTSDFHARFDATSRSYEFRIHTTKDPFKNRFSYRYYGSLEIEKLQECLDVISSYQAFFPFCKSKTDVKTMDCDIREAQWMSEGEGNYVMRITADRFLRGMIRLIVGACINYNKGKLAIADIKKSLDVQSLLSTSYSVPACGLCLMDIKYPEK